MRSPRAAVTLLAAALMFATVAPALRAQIATSATPKYHGTLQIRPAVGTLDNHTGIGTLRVRGWRLVLAANSNGIFPGQKPVVVALGAGRFSLTTGSLTPSHHGKVFRYQAARAATPPAIRFFRIARRTDGSYLVSCTLIGVDFSPLVVQNPVCQPMAVIVGDNDGFTGVNLTRPSFQLAARRPPAELQRERLAVDSELSAAPV